MRRIIGNNEQVADRISNIEYKMIDYDKKIRIAYFHDGVFLI